VIYKCKGCGSIVYRFERVGQDCYGLPTPSELAARFDGSCPVCGRQLSKPALNDVVILGRVRSEHLMLRGEDQLLVNELPITHGGVLTTATANH